MVERITVNPEGIRGLGNIVNKHDTDDYITYNCSIEEGTAIIGGVETEVYEMDTESSAITVSLSASATNVTVGTIVTLTATVLNESTPVANADVDFRLGTTVIATSTTNSNGVATYDYTTDTIGTVSMYARSHNVLSTGVDITAIKHTTTTTMTTDHSTVLVLSDVLLTATVVDEDDNPLVHEEVWFYSNWGRVQYLAGGYTDGNGVATYSYHTNRTGDIEVYAIHPNSEYYDRSESNHVTLKVTNYTLDVELGIAQIVGSTVTFHLTAKHEGSLVTDSLNFKLYDDGTQIQTGTLTTGGANLVVNNASGDYKVVIEESTNYPESESNTVTV